jgi:hypothetical protein
MSQSNQSLNYFVDELFNFQGHGSGYAIGEGRSDVPILTGFLTKEHAERAIKFIVNMQERHAQLHAKIDLTQVQSFLDVDFDLQQIVQKQAQLKHAFVCGHLDQARNFCEELQVRVDHSKATWTDLKNDIIQASKPIKQ